MANILRSFREFAARKQRLDADGRKLVDQLNEVLPEIGYRVVPAGEEAGAERRSARSRMATGRRTLKCPECPRTFSQPMNLGRHLSATHKIKARRSAATSSRKRAA